MGINIRQILFVLLTTFTCVAQSEKERVAIPRPLKEYLQLSDQQHLRLADALSQYKSFLLLKHNQMRSIEMKAAADPGVNANRLIEEYQAAIDKMRSETRGQICKTLSPTQLAKLKGLEEDHPEDPGHAALATQAIALDLIDGRGRAKQQSFGGTTAIFSADTASQPEVSDQPPRKKGIAKRKPPSSPPP